MENQTLSAEVRAERGKGPARRLRMQGMIPGVVYGPGLEPTPLKVSPKALVKVLSGAYGRNAVIDLELGGRTETVMVKELTVHPVTRVPVHVDFYKVTADRPVTVDIPFRTKGRSRGQQAGGKLNVTVRTLPLRGPHDKVPAEIVADVSALEIGQTLRVRDLTPPEGLTFLVSGQVTVVSVMEDRRAAKAAEEEAAGEAAPA